LAPQTKSQDTSASLDDIKITGTQVAKGREGLGPGELVRRAKIKARAQELIAGGMPMAQAAQQAFGEIGIGILTPEEKKQKAIDDAALASRQATQKLENTRAAYVDQRAEVLKESGITEPVARSQAEQEFEKDYLSPVTSPYGELSERQVGGAVFGAGKIKAAPPTSVSRQPATLGTALRPQTVIPESAVQTERARALEPGYAGIIGAGPDYTKINEQLLDDGLTPGDAASQIAALQSAYNTNLIRAKSEAQRNKQALSPDFLQQIWTQTVEEIKDVPRVLGNKEGYVKDYKPEGPQDPLFLAFSKQVKAGEGVPSVTPGQGKYIATLAAADRREAEKRIRDEYKDKPLVITETEAVEGIRGARPLTTTRELSGADKDAEIARMAAAQVQTPWWTNPAEVEKRLASPDRFTTPGVFSEETAFGTQRESSVGYALRSAMAPLNAIAGAVFPELFIGTGETKEAVEEARRRARPQAYKDSPILLNIAEGRGFVGEASDVANITGLNTDKVLGSITLGDIYKAGAFAADLLDPSLDVLIAANRGRAVGMGAAAAAKAAGIKQPLSFATSQGLKEAGKAVVFENPALSTLNELASFAKIPKLEPGDIRIAISEKLADEATSVLGAGRARTPNVARISESSVLKAADAKLQALDDAISGTASGRPGLTREDIRSAVGEALTRNPSIVVSDIRGFKILDELKTNDALYNATQKALSDNAVRRGVFEATKDSVLKSGIVSVTPKVFATRDQAKKIIADYRSTPFAKEVGKITSSQNYGFVRQQLPNRPGDTVAPTVVRQGFNVTDPTVISNELRRLSTKGLLSPERSAEISGRLSNNFISSTDLRALIDAGIEESAAKFKVIKGADIAELNPIVSKELAKPIEVRDLSAPQFRNWIAKRGGLDIPKEVLTASQQGFVDEVIGTVSNLDKRLRGDLEKILKDPAFRSAYNVPEGVSLTREEAIGYLIAGPKGFNRDEIANTLKLAVDKNFFQEAYVNDIFDVLKGVKLSESTDVWSQVGRDRLKQLARIASSRVADNPATFYREMNELVKDAKDLLGDAANLKVPASQIKSPKGDSTSQTLVASYYEAESAKAIRESLNKIVNSDGESVYSAGLFSTVDDILGPMPVPVDEADLQRILRTRSPGAFLQKFMPDYVHALLTDPGFDTLTAIERFNRIAPGRSASPEAVSKLIAEADGAARKIMRNNRFDPIRNPVDDVTSIVRKAFEDESLAASVDALVGKEVANQIRSSLNSGSSNSIQAQLSRLISESHKDPTAMSVLGSIYDAMISSFYTLVLTAAPRFHGANIIGAPGLIYSTTGRILDPLSFIDSLKVTRLADTARGGTTIVTDPAGRKYSANELYRIIGERGGQSVFKADLPSLQARTAMAAVAEGKSGSLKRGIDWALSTPEKEDAVFRTAVAISALKEGRTIDDAAKLARESLYDKGLITDSEAQLQKLLLFYSFTRGNMVNLLKNLSTPNGWKRIVNTAKFKRGVEEMLVDPNERKWAPETAATRVILGRLGTKDVGEKGVMLASPPDSTLSAIEMLINLVGGDIAGVASGMMKPGQSMLFKESADTEMDKIPAEHIFIYDKLADITGSSVSDILEAITGEQITPVRSKDPDAIDGYIYPMLSKESRSRYKLMMNMTGYVGLGRIMTDYPNIIGAEGGKAATSFAPGPTGELAKLAYKIGFAAPLKTLSGEQQRLKNLIAQDAEGRKLVKDIDGIMLEGKITPKPGDIEGYAERIESGKERRAEGRLGIEELNREKLRLKAEIDGIRAKIMADPARERREIYKQEIYKRRDRINEIRNLEKEGQKQEPK